jgi:hypothetical protein
VFPDSSAAKPFLTIEADRKLALHPLLFASDGAADETTEDAIIIQEAIVADQTCAMEKWVHIGCEVGSFFHTCRAEFSHMQSYFLSLPLVTLLFLLYLTSCVCWHTTFFSDIEWNKWYFYFILFVYCPS